MFLSLPPFWASWLPASKARLSADCEAAQSPFLSSCSAIRRTSCGLTDLLLKPAELRIDVHTGIDAIEHELQSLHGRLHRPGDSMHNIGRLQFLDDPRFAVHHRVADGEIYVYIEDLREQRLAGYTVFNRLIELNKRADRLLRAPHTKFAPPYQRKGLATALYRWSLDGGQCLISGARQSPGAHALWNRLARDYEEGYVYLLDKTVTYLGTKVTEPRLMDDLNTRRILLGRDWTVEGLANAMRMQISPSAVLEEQSVEEDLAA